MKSDVSIAQSAKVEAIEKVAKKLNLSERALEMYGKTKAKILVDKIESTKKSKLILVTAISPTKAGEGKTTTTVGLVDGLNFLGYSCCGALREPSLGPVFGIKGGATGGGYAQVIPMEDINLHFTGDLHAITACNNLISAVIDNHLFQGNELNIDAERIIWKRCLDLNDRSLRKIEVGLSSKKEVKRFDGFNITVASEIMAILCLVNNLEEFRERVDKILIAYNKKGMPVYVKDLDITGSLLVLMKDAIKPNLVQTLENNPILMHGGPFANIAHGCNSIIATKTAMKLADYTITEAGFGADLGAEKFLDIKCRAHNIKPDAVVMVATIRALKLHGGLAYSELANENIPALAKGILNLEKHLDTIDQFGLPKIVALNKFSSDSDKELAYLIEWCCDRGIEISLCDGWKSGSVGMADLAQKVVNLAQKESELNFIYDLNDSVETKITKIVQKVYGGKGVIFTKEAQEELANIKKNSWDKLPVCIAKTPNSLSDDAKQLEHLSDFDITVKGITPSLGAGFLVILTGAIMRMPGLGKNIAATSIDIIDDKIVGLS
ncbi:MAG: formate--tetrahydrofolate ligase [Erysipelotrichaceae bacterium]